MHKLTNVSFSCIKTVIIATAFVLAHSVLWGQEPLWNSHNIGIPPDGVEGEVPTATAPWLVMRGGGTGIGGAHDSFHLIYSPGLMLGNVEIEARVDFGALSSQPSGTEGGVMLRQSTLSTAAFASLVVTPQGDVKFKWRSEAGFTGAETLDSLTEGGLFCWLRLVRSGSFVAGYKSADGVNWDLVGSAVYQPSAAVSQPFYTGLCVTSQEPQVLSDVAFDHIKMLPWVPQAITPIKVAGVPTTSSIKLWLRADWNVSYDSANLASFWEDQSGYANDATSIPLNRPTLVHDSIGGKPALDFPTAAAAERKFMTVQTHESLTNTGGTLFVVAGWPNTQSATAGIVSKGTASTGYYMGTKNVPVTEAGVTQNKALPHFRVVNTSRVWPASSPINLSASHLLCGEFTNGQALSLRLRSDGLAPLAATTSPTLAADTKPLYIGQLLSGTTAYPFVGHIAEILLFDKVLDDETRRNVEQYFRLKYNLSITSATPAAPVVRLGSSNARSGIFTGASGTDIISITVPENAMVYYSINGGPKQLYTGPFVPSAGTRMITAWVEKPGYPTGATVTHQIIVDPDTQYVARNGLKLWLRGDAGISRTEDDRIVSWKDQAAGSLEAKSTAPYTPLYVSSESHGKPVVSFPAGVSSRMSVAGASPALDLKNGHTIYVVTKPASELYADSVGSQAALLSRTSTSSATAQGYQLLLRKESDPEGSLGLLSRVARYNSGSSGASSFLDASSSNTNHFLTASSWNVLSSRATLMARNLRVNTKDSAQTWPSPVGQIVAPTTDLFLGLSVASGSPDRFFSGEIAEILVYDRSLGLKEYKELDAYLAERYGTVRPAASVASSHTSGTYVAAASLIVTFTSADEAPISYRIQQEGIWSEWTTAQSGPVQVSLDANASAIKTYLVEARAEKTGFTSTTLSRTFTLDPNSADVPRANLKLWLRADVGVTADASGRVSAWKDQSTSQNDLVASGTARPLLNAGTESLPARITFGSGTATSRMTKSANNTAFTLGARPDNDWAVFAVVRSTSTLGTGTLVEQSSDASTPNGFLLQLEHASADTIPRLRGQMLPNTAVFSQPPAYALSPGFHLLSQQISTSSGVLRQLLQINRGHSNDPTTATQTASTDPAEQIFSLGARRATASFPEKWIGDIVELLIYDKPLTSMEVDAVEASLTRRYELSDIQQKPKLAKPSATPDQGCWKPGVVVELSHAVAGVSYQFRYWADDSSPGDWNTASNSFPITGTGFMNVEVQALKGGYDPSDSLVFRLEVDPGVVMLPRNKLALWFRADKGIEAPITAPTRVQRWHDQSGGKHYLEAVSATRRPIVASSATIKTRTEGVLGGLAANVIRFPFNSDAGNSVMFKLGSQTSGVGALLKPDSKVFMVCRFDTIPTTSRPPYARRTFLQVVKPGYGAAGKWSIYAYASGNNQSLGASQQDSNLATQPSLLFSNTSADRSKPVLLTAGVNVGLSVFPGLGRTAQETTGVWPSFSVTASSDQQVYIGGSEPFAFSGYLPTFGGSVTISGVPVEHQNMLAVGMRVNAGNIEGSKTYIANPNPAVGQVTISSDTSAGATSTSFTASSFMEGEIAELLIYDGEFSAEDENRVKDYLVGRYVFDAAKPFTPPTITPAVSVLAQGASITVTPPPDTAIFKVNGIEHPADQPVTLTVGVGQPRLVVTAEATPANPGYASSEAQAVYVIDPHADLVSKPGLKLWIRGDTVSNAEAIESGESLTVDSWLDASGSGRHLKLASVMGATLPIALEHAPATGTAVVSGGSVTAITLENGGSGYYHPPIVKLVGGNETAPSDPPNEDATAVAEITDGVVTSITVTSGGSGYTEAPTVVILAPFNQKPYVRFRASSKNVLETFTQGFDSGIASVFAVLRRTTAGATASTRIAGSYYDPPDTPVVTPPGGFALNLTADTAKTTLAFRTAASTTGLLSQNLTSMFGRAEDQGILFMGATSDGTATQLLERGNTIKTGSLPATLPSVAPFFVGGSKTATEFLNADLAELLVYDRPLSRDEIDNLTVYIQERYGIEILKKVPTPVPNRLGGTYAAPVYVRLSSLMPGCTIRYVLGDADEPLSSLADPSIDPPDGESVAFNHLDLASFITVSGGTRYLKARAFREGFLPSNVLSLEYRFDSSATFNRNGLALWLRADTGVVEESGKVARWRDQSGLGNDAVGPNNTTHRPQVVAGTSGLSGSVIKFSDPTSTLPIRLEVPHHASLNSGTMTMIAVARKTGTVSGILGKKGGFILRLGGAVTSGSVPLPKVIVSTNGTTSQTDITKDKFNLVSGSADGAFRRVSNGVTTVSAAFTTPLTTDSLPFYIGPNAVASATTSTGALQGEIAELLVFNRGLSLTERQEVERYLNVRFGTLITAALSKPVFWPSPASLGGTYVLEEPAEIALYGPAGAAIYWTTDPALSKDDLEQWHMYAQPLPVYHTTTFRAFCRTGDQPARVSEETAMTYWLDPEKYPGPVDLDGDDSPPVITLEKPIHDEATP